MFLKALKWSKTSVPNQDKNIYDNLIITGMYYVILIVQNSCPVAKFQCFWWLDNHLQACTTPRWWSWRQPPLCLVWWSWGSTTRFLLIQWFLQFKHVPIFKKYANSNTLLVLRCSHHSITHIYPYGWSILAVNILSLLIYLLRWDILWRYPWCQEILYNFVIPRAGEVYLFPSTCGE